jgi:beta-glucosidase
MKRVGLPLVTLTGLFICAFTARGEQGTEKLSSNSVEQRVDTILSQMTLLQKLSYIGGTGFFDIKPIPVTVGPLNPQIFQTDGPNGVRRNSPSVRFPSGLTLASTWSRTLSHDYGTGMGQDTRARGYFSILGPGMDLYRVPLGGRNFEYMNGEDPYLGGQLVPHVIQGIQEQGAWSCAKHFVCNDEEENRTQVLIQIDERTLREIYLPVFEAAVKDGHVATVMGAYNAIPNFGVGQGLFCSENAFLLNQVLKHEWNFRGLLMSDYNAIHDGLTAALYGCDLDLPAGNFMNANNLLSFIPSPLTVASIDDKVRRILREVISFGYLDRQQLNPNIPLDNPFSETTSLNVAREGIILLKNRANLLPLSGQTRSIAVVGNIAQLAPPTGFGSSFVTPISFVSELQGIKNQAPAGTTVDLIASNTLDPENSTWEFINSLGELQQGLQAEYFDSNDLSGSPEVTRVDNHVNFNWDSDPIPVSQNQGGFSARWTTQVQPTISGDHVFKIRGDGGLRVIVNGQTLIDNFNNPPRPPVGYGPTPAYSGKIALQAGHVYNVEIDYRRVGGFFNSFEQGGLTGIQVSWASLKAPPNFAKYDAVIIAAGINEAYEGEGYDRPFQLPEFQDELIQNLSLVNPRTIVVFHGGGNFDSQKWINQVGGLLEAFYPGQNGGQALAEILFGEVNPSGKLPVTFEKRIEDNPAYATFPKAINTHPDSIAYSEGIFVGYRGYEKNGTKPLFPFGFGLSYTTFQYSGIKIEPAVFDGTHPVTVSFTVTNTGRRAGAEIAELYVGEKNSSVPRPLKELKGFDKVFLQPGQSQLVTLHLNQRSFAFFNTSKHLWDAEPGVYDVSVGASSQDIRLTGQVTLNSDITSSP